MKRLNENILYSHTYIHNCDNMEFRIKEVCDHKGFTMKYIAEKAGITPSYLSRIDSGDKYPGRELLKRIADALNSPIPELIKTSEGYGHFYVNGVWEGIRKV